MHSAPYSALTQRLRNGLAHRRKRKVDASWHGHAAGRCEDLGGISSSLGGLLLSGLLRLLQLLERVLGEGLPGRKHPEQYGHARRASEGVCSVKTADSRLCDHQRRSTETSYVSPARNGPAVFTWLSDSQPAALRPRGRRQNGASRSPLAVVPRAHEAARHRDRPTGEWHARAHTSTCPFSSRTTSSFLSAGGGVFVSAILLSCTRAGGPSTRFLAYAPQHAPFHPGKRERRTADQWRRQCSPCPTGSTSPRRRASRCASTRT